MKNRLLKCWLVLLGIALTCGLGQRNVASAQCLQFNGPAGNVLTAFLDVYPNFPNCNAYFNTVVQTTNQPLALGTYLTWCVDQGNYIDPSQGYTVPGTIYTGALFATCDPNLNSKLPPGYSASSYVSPAVWQQVNYLLNHKGTAYYWDVQAAINGLVGGPFIDTGSNYPTEHPDVVAALLAAATNNAAAWSPKCGDVLGALYSITNQAGVTLTSPVQLLMIEVPYCQITFTKVPASTNLGCNPASIPSVNTNLVCATNCCGTTVTVTGTQSQSTNGCLITRSITYTATDSFANATNYVQTITWTVDTTIPVILSYPTGTDLGCNPKTLPADSSVQALVSATDGCSTTTITVSHVDGGTACGMTRTFTICVTDACGNKATPKTVIYTWKIDTTIPVITSAPTNSALGCNPASLPTDASIAAKVVASDNCTVSSTNVSHVDVTNNCSVTRTFTITVTDECGNTSAASVAVYSWTVDITAPVLTCPPDITISNTPPSYCTFMPCDYGASCNGSNAASLFTNCFARCYKGGLFCGITNTSGYNCLKFTTCSNLQKFLACATTPACLKSSYTNVNSCEAGLFGAHVTCLKLNVDFSDCSALTGFSSGCGDLVINDPGTPWHGYSVRQILAFCHYGLGGGDVTPWGCTISNLTTLCSNLNQSFQNCGQSAWCRGHLLPPAITNVSPTVTGYATTSDKCGSTPTVTYKDTIVAGQCAGNYAIQRVWMAVDGCNNTNTCTQNIYVGASTASICGSVFNDLNGDGMLTPLEPGMSNVTVTLYSNKVAIATQVSDAQGNYCFYNLAPGTYTVTVVCPASSCQTGGTHVPHWIDANNNQCWYENDGYQHCKGSNGIDCWKANDGYQHCKNKSGQDCWTDSKNICHTQSCTYVSCDVPKTNSEVVTVAACDALTCVNFAYMGTNPKVSMCATGPSQCPWWQPINYTCCVTNCGNTVLSGCSVTCNGGSYSCPTLNPGQGCSIPVTVQCKSYYFGNYTCQHNFSCSWPGSSTPCTSQTSCSTFLTLW